MPLFQGDWVALARNDITVITSKDQVEAEILGNHGVIPLPPPDSLMWFVSGKPVASSQIPANEREDMWLDIAYAVIREVH